MGFLIQTLFWVHLILAFAGVIAAYLIIRQFVQRLQYQLPIAFFSIFTIGLVYELYQGKARDTGTDLTADIIGAILGVMIIVIYNKVKK